jgi:transcription elongation factor Elf1
MGGRKKTTKKEKKLRTYTLPKSFDCEICSADKSVEIKM